MNYQLRKCKLADIEQLVILCANHAAYEQSSYSTSGKAEKLTEAIFGANPSVYCWVVDSNNELAGYFSYTIDYSTWDATHFLHLDCLYLEPDYRNIGIGKDIVNKLSVLAREHGCTTMQWQTPDFNTKAIRFYERLGAKKKSKIRFYLNVSGI